MVKGITGTFDATATSTLDLTERELQNTPHVFIGVKFIGAGGSFVTPSAGTFSLTVKSRGMENFESIQSGDVIDATAALSSLSFTGNATALKYTPTGITGANEVRITVTGNLS